jgi:pimeloyl-ACP methyl ester carboxylesterase
MRDVFHSPAHCTAELISHVRSILSDMRRVLHMVRVAACAKRDNLRDELPAVACPVLLVWGSNDLVTPPSAAEEFKRLLPDSRLHFVPDCGHVPMVEHPEVFNALLVDFLNRIPPPEAPAPAASPSHASAAHQFSCA